jgi:hypothetical protein
MGNRLTLYPNVLQLLAHTGTAFRSSGLTGSGMRPQSMPPGEWVARPKTAPSGGG